MAVKTKTDAAAEPAEKPEDIVIAEPSAETKELVGRSDEFCCYLGPSIRGVIQEGAVFTGTKEQALDALSAAVAAYPLIAGLIVSGAMIAEERVKVKTSGNLLNVSYKRLAAGKSR
ncbi:MAG: hypothetical protein LBK75_08675 [Oscillospiraceae bacterium]|jgi:hypothetical protein|nr:hypothetical protein [Oscillospiraceae bacterium]